MGIYPRGGDFVKGKILVTDDGAFGLLPTGHADMTCRTNDNKAITAMGGLFSSFPSSPEGTGMVLEDND
ncbi:MAG: hypothetical protein LBU07_04730 [Coriobacteriales bacterium]|nr:hypothetical protein [Coriobacteriales bacterium]